MNLLTQKLCRKVKKKAIQIEKKIYQNKLKSLLDCVINLTFCLSLMSNQFIF
jgi:hypothetical protein